MEVLDKPELHFGDPSHVDSVRDVLVPDLASWLVLKSFAGTDHVQTEPFEAIQCGHSMRCGSASRSRTGPLCATRACGTLATCFLRSRMTPLGSVLHRYRYQPRRWLWLVLLFFAACSIVLSVQWRQEQTAETLCLAGGSWLFTLVLAGAMLWRSCLRQTLVLAERGVGVPHSWSNSVRWIALDAITALSLRNIHGQQLLSIHHDGRCTVLNASLLPRNEDFTRVRAFLQTGWWKMDDTAPVLDLKQMGRSGLLASFHSGSTAPKWFMLLVKVLALLAFCGGPLWLTDQLQPALSRLVAFVVASAPVMLAVFGVVSMAEEHPMTAWRVVAWVGALGVVALLPLGTWATLQCFDGQCGHSSTGLVLFGAFCGLVASVAYLWMLRLYLR
ncbi:MAG: hypothetical protein ACPGUV_04895 [Polyangiales bacterium]